MNLNTLTNGEPWMTPEERDLNHAFIQSTTELLAARGVPETPLVLIRVNHVIATWLLARRLESVLTPTETDPAPCPTPAQANAIGKCRDRLHRATKELEACCTHTRTRAKSAPSLSDHIYETMRMLEDSLPLTDPPPANTNSAQDPETPPNNPNPAENPPAAPRQTPAQRDHTPQTSPTAPSTREARAGGNSNPSSVNPKAFRAWTARAKAPPQ